MKKINKIQHEEYVRTLDVLYPSDDLLTYKEWHQYRNSLLEMLKTQWIEDNGCCETGQFFVGEDWFGRRKLGIIICDNCMIEESFFNEIRNWLNKQNDDYCITIVGETSLMFYFAVFTNQIILSFYQSPEEIEMLCEKYMEVKRWFKAIEKLLEQ